MSSSLGGSIAGAMAQAAQAAAVNESFNSARSSIAENNEKAHGWAAYCAQLEEQAVKLSNAISREIAIRSELNAQLNQLKIDAHRSSKLIDTSSAIDALNEDKERVARLKKRLRQLEKALQHSSADHESLKVVFDSHKQIVEKMQLGELLPENLVEIADKAWSEFMGGEKLVINSAIEKSIDPPSR